MENPMTSASTIASRAALPMFEVLHFAGHALPGVAVGLAYDWPGPGHEGSELFGRFAARKYGNGCLRELDPFEPVSQKRTLELARAVGRKRRTEPSGRFALHGHAGEHS